MWIQIDTPTRRLKTPFMDSPIEFSENGTAQVSSEVGDRLTSELDAVSEYNNE